MAPFHAGTARADITPTAQELAELTPMLGYNTNVFPDGALRPLMARALVTSTTHRSIVLITADLHNTPKWLSDEIRDTLAAEINIDRAAVAVCTSQTHSSPEVFPREWSYTQRLLEAVVSCARRANDSLQPASIGATRGYCHGISYNTNVPITRETPTDFYPSARHLGGMMYARDPVIGRTGGRPFDPEVGVIRIDGAHGGPLAVLFHFSAHPATCIEGSQLHGDYVGFAAEALERTFPDTTAMFLQGSVASAQIIPIFGTWQDAKRSGERLASEVSRVLPDAVMAERVTDAAFCRPFPVTLMPYPTERIQEIAESVRTYLEELNTNPHACWFGAGPNTINLPIGFDAHRKGQAVLPILKYCEDKLGRRARGETECLSPMDTDVQIIRWNDIALCLHAFEMYYQTGFEIKRLSPYRYTFPVGNANSIVGYVAPEEEFAYGGYNVVTNPMYAGIPGMRDPANCDRIITAFRGGLA